MDGQHGGLKNRDILDFGCGEGTTAIAIALGRGARRVVGLDIIPEVARCLPLAQKQLGLKTLPPNLNLHQIEPGKLHNPDEKFDVIYSWSVFEHIDQTILQDVLTQLRSALRPNGLIFIQIAPLYYSSQGSHLCHLLPEPWGHLLIQESSLLADDNSYRARLKRACVDSAQFESLWALYTTLNRIMAKHLVNEIESAGFEIVREYHTQEELKPPQRLLDVYQAEVLTTNQVVILAR